MITNIREFINKNPYKYYNIAIYYGAIKNILDREIFIKALGGSQPFAFKALKQLRDFSDYCEKNGLEGFPTPIFDNQIARGYDQLSVLLALGATENDFLFIEKQYKPKLFDESWLASFLNKKEIAQVKKIYDSLLSK